MSVIAVETKREEMGEQKEEGGRGMKVGHLTPRGMAGHVSF